MVSAELAEIVEIIDTTTDDEWWDFLEFLLDHCYEEVEQQDN